MQPSLSKKTTQEKVFTNVNLIQTPTEYLVYTNKYLCGNLEFTKYGHTYFLRLSLSTTMWNNYYTPFWGDGG